MDHGETHSLGNEEDLRLEQALRRVSWRQPPAEWRAGILGSAQPSGTMAREPRPVATPPWWRAGWGLAAAAWAVVVSMNLLAAIPIGEAVASRPPPSPALVELLREQRFALAVGAISVLTTVAPRAASRQNP